MSGQEGTTHEHVGLKACRVQELQNCAGGILESTHELATAELFNPPELDPRDARAADERRFPGCEGCLGGGQTGARAPDCVDCELDALERGRRDLVADLYQLASERTSAGGAMDE